MAKFQVAGWLSSYTFRGVQYQQGKVYEVEDPVQFQALMAERDDYSRPYLVSVSPEEAEAMAPAPVEVPKDAEAPKVVPSTKGIGKSKGHKPTVAVAPTTEPKTTVESVEAPAPVGVKV